MAIYNGVYRWDGTKRDGQDPIAWSPGAYNVKIYRRPTVSEKVELLKPYVCVYSTTGKGHSISAKPEKFAKKLCDEFALDIDRVLWVEDLLTESDRYEVVTFSKSAQVGETSFYTTEKRKAKQGEIAQLEEELEQIGCIGSDVQHSASL